MPAALWALLLYQQGLTLGARAGASQLCPGPKGPGGMGAPGACSLGTCRARCPRSGQREGWFPPLELRRLETAGLVWKDISMGPASTGRNSSHLHPQVLPQPWMEPHVGEQDTAGTGLPDHRGGLRPWRDSAWGHLPSVGPTAAHSTPSGKVEDVVCIEGTWRVLSLGAQPTFPRHCHPGHECSLGRAPTHPSPHSGAALPQSLHPEPRQEGHVSGLLPRVG